MWRHFCFTIFLAIFPTTLQDKLMEGNEDFANHVLKEIVTTYSLTNVAIPPFFMDRDLSLMIFACKNQTLKEVKNAMQWNDLDPKAVMQFFEKYPAGIECKSKLFYDRKFRIRKSFTKIVESYFHEKPVEFSNENLKSFDKFTRKHIDRVIQTNNDTLLGNTNYNLKHHALVIISVVTFKGQWETPFPKQSRIKDFYNWGKHITQVMTMYGVQRVGYVDLPAFRAKAINLPFKNSKMQMLLMLPSQEDADKPWTNEIDLSDVLDRMTFEKVAISLPVFQVNYGIGSDKSMVNYTLDRIFSSSAELGGALGNFTPHKYPFFFHRTYLSFTELGCSLTAGDQKKIEENSADSSKSLTPEKFFIAERPFVFILHEDGLMRISGQIVALNVAANALPPKEVPKSKDNHVSDEDD